MWRVLLPIVAVVGVSLVGLALTLSVLNGVSLLELPGWLSSAITAETTPSAPRSQPTGGSPPLAVARQQAESDASQQRTDTLQAQMNGLQQQADALQNDLQKEVAERQQQLQQMRGLQGQEVQQLADVLQKEATERQQQMNGLQQQADALRNEMAEQRQQQQQELRQMARGPYQPSIQHGTRHHRPNGAHRHRGQSMSEEEATVRRFLLGDDLCARGFPAAAVDDVCPKSLAELSARDREEVGKWLLDVMTLPPGKRAETMRPVLTSAPVPSHPKRRPTKLDARNTSRDVGRRQ